MSGAVRNELSAGTARRIPYAEQSKRPVEGPKGCYFHNAVRNELSAATRRYRSFGMVMVSTIWLSVSRRSEMALMPLRWIF